MFNNSQNTSTEDQIEKLKTDLVLAIDKNIDLSQEGIDSFTKILSDFKKNKYHKHDSFLNLCIFSDIVVIDLTILLEKIRLAKREQEKKLYARVIALTIVDFLDNIGVLIGRDCLAELKTNNMTEFLEEFKTIHKRFSLFKKDNERVLRDIRNNTIAHKSKDALKLNKSISGLDIESIYELGLNLKIYTKEFIDLSTKIIYYIIDDMKDGRRI